LPTADSQPRGITTGPDGALWFTEAKANKVGRITLAGVITEYPLTTPASNPVSIVSGHDGHLWFAQVLANKVGRISVAGVVTEFASGQPWYMTAGPDGKVWLSMVTGAKGDRTLARIDGEGIIEVLPMPSAGASPLALTTGADGNVWFTEVVNGRVGKVTPVGGYSHVDILTRGTSPFGIGAAKNEGDGRIWYTVPRVRKVGCISATGPIAEFQVPTPFSEPELLTVDQEGIVWFVERGVGKIGQLVP
ncbi:MAG TPA: Virginiamycin B lyase, partial [Polyangia bacterium]